ncbi:MAG: hypothetical protein DRQ55_06635 [Planctomycetota bacterium]|nr:MAG: hypothetical protein DRQ55_06635 [Planctomycetota bacterium]
MSPRGRVAAGLLLGLALLGGACSPSVYSDIRFRAGQRRLASGTVPEQGWSKARVLAQLGAPGELLPQPDGDIFVYRLRLIDQIIWNIDTRFVAPVAVPIYVSVKGERWDRMVFVSFDPSGLVASTAVTDA